MQLAWRAFSPTSRLDWRTCKGFSKSLKPANDIQRNECFYKRSLTQCRSIHQTGNGRNDFGMFWRQRFLRESPRFKFTKPAVWLTSQRTLSYFRKVSFPVASSIPVVWVVYSLITCWNVSEHIQFLRRMDTKSWIRQASSENWGVERAIVGMIKLIRATQIIKGDEDKGWINATPEIVAGGVIKKVILPSLQSDTHDIVAVAAELLGSIASQRHMRLELSRDPVLFEAVVSGLEKWIDIEHPTMGNPSPAFSGLVYALLDLFHEKNDNESKSIAKAKLDRIISVMNKLSKKIENAQRSASRAVAHGGGGLNTYSRGWSYGDDRNGWNQMPLPQNFSKEWYIHVGYAAADICDRISDEFPESCPKLIPAFNSLTKALGKVDITALDLDSDDIFEMITECPTFEFGIRIFQSLQKESSPGSRSESDRVTFRQCPEYVPKEEWNYFRKTRRFFDEVDGNMYFRLIQAFDKVEKYLAPVLYIGASGLLGFTWGAMRSAFILRNVENPANTNVFSSSTSYSAANTFSSTPQYSPDSYAANQYPHSQTSSSGSGYRYGGHAPPYNNSSDAFMNGSNSGGSGSGWKRAIIMKHARLAAMGTMIMCGLSELNTLIGDHIWFSDRNTQIGIAFPKVLLDLTIFLGVLRNMPFTFLPTILLKTSEEHIVLETRSSSNSGSSPEFA